MGEWHRKLKSMKSLSRLLKDFWRHTPWGWDLKIVFGADFNMSLDSESNGLAYLKLAEIINLGSLVDVFKCFKKCPP